MVVYVIVSNYFDSGLFGSYSTMKRARKVIETFLAEDKNVESIEKLDDYVYQFTTKNGETFSMEILWDIIDAEYEEGIVKEEEYECNPMLCVDNCNTCPVYCGKE